MHSILNSLTSWGVCAWNKNRYPKRENQGILCDLKTKTVSRYVKLVGGEKKPRQKTPTDLHRGKKKNPISVYENDKTAWSASNESGLLKLRSQILY